MSQSADILSHLQRRSITPLEALALYGCMRLAPRIQELKLQGHEIVTTIERRNGKKFARYTLIRKKND